MLVLLNLSLLVNGMGSSSLLFILPSGGASGALAVLCRKCSHLSPSKRSRFSLSPTHYLCFLLSGDVKVTLDLLNIPVLFAISQWRATKAVFTMMYATLGFILNASVYRMMSILNSNSLINPGVARRSSTLSQYLKLRLDLQFFLSAASLFNNCLLRLLLTPHLMPLTPVSSPGVLIINPILHHHLA